MQPLYPYRGRGRRGKYIFAKVRICISKIIPQTYFPVFARVRIQAPRACAQKFLKIFFLHVLVLCRGVMREGPGVNRHILVGFLNWLGAFLAPGSPSPLVRQVCEHPAFCVTSSALFRQNSGRFQSFIRQFAWALFRYFQTILGSFRQS